MNPWGPFAAFVVVGGAWTIAWCWAVAQTSGPPQPYDEISRAGGRIRWRLFSAITAVLACVFVASIWWLPYRSIAAARLGKPLVTVAVTGRMWDWTLSQAQVPPGVPVEFDVTAADVNHGFGIYAPSGRLFAQVQAMPGFVNRLIVRFDQPGQYTVRCLEYCGVPHTSMVTTFNVR